MRCQNDVFKPFWESASEFVYRSAIGIGLAASPMHRNFSTRYVTLFYIDTRAETFEKNFPKFCRLFLPFLRTKAAFDIRRFSLAQVLDRTVDADEGPLVTTAQFVGGALWTGTGDFPCKDTYEQVDFPKTGDWPGYAGFN